MSISQILDIEFPKQQELKLDTTLQGVTVLDSTKIQTYLKCPRMYFFQYVLGLQIDLPNKHLVFGQAWHLALEHVILGKYTAQSIDEAMVLFLDLYRGSFFEETDMLNAPKNPQNAEKALRQYCKKWASDISTYRVLATEQAGAVPISKTEVLHYRMDTILEEIATGKVLSLEHKSGSAVSQAWFDSWQQKFQIFTYMHVLRMLYGANADAIIVNGVFLQKGENKFERYTVKKTKDNMKDWLFHANMYVSGIRYFLEKVASEKASSDLMESFPKNTENCISYFRLCDYSVICQQYNNPLRMDTVPEGFVQRFWNPLEEEVKAKVVVNINPDAIEDK